MTVVIFSKFIYEFDLKNFFPSVKHKTLLARLGTLGLPLWVRMYASNLINVEAKAPHQDKIEDYVYNTKAVPFGSAPLRDLHPNEPGRNPHRKGLAMGSAYSPLLAVICLIDWEICLRRHNLRALMYADDGIIYTNDWEGTKEKFISIVNHPVLFPYGITMNLEKSRFVKWEGK